MNPISVLQELYQQFPHHNDPLFHVSQVEKILQKKIGLTQAVFAYRQKEGLKNVEGKSPFTPREQKSVLWSLSRALKPWICSKKESAKWLGFWPVVIGKDWIACYGLGRKTKGSGLTNEEKQLMELLVDRTAYDLEARRLWKYLEKADRQASLGFMSAAMVHEIRNPLTALGTLIQLLPQKKDNQEFMESFQRLMLREINHLTRLTETFLNFSKSNPEKAELVDFKRVVNQVIQLLGPLFASKRVRLKMDTAQSLFLRGDEQQIESLIMNLLQNAFQSAGPQGTVAISTGFLPRVNGSGPWVELQVKDNGAGISKENMGKIFDPYFSTKGEGTGLGLAICQKVIENHQGLMTAKCPSKRGTVFRVLLPAVGKS